MPMRNAPLCCLAAMLLMTPLLSQPDQPEPFSFKDDKLGMSLEAFKAKHVHPGYWQNEATKIIAPGGDSHRRPLGKGNWTWKPDMDCKEVKVLITRCEYTTTVAGIQWVHAAAVFVEQKLAVISVSYSTHSPTVQEALANKLGPPVNITRNGFSALRWDNGVSVVEFQEHYCGRAQYGGQRGWNKEVADVLRGTYCDNEDARDYHTAFIWYVHRSLANLALTRWKEAIEKDEKAVRSDL